MLVHWIWLSTRKGMNDYLKYQLLRSFSNPEAVYLARESAYREVPGMTAEAVSALNDKSLTRAIGILKQCRQKDIRIVTCEDEGYPCRLKEIYDPPLLLYYRGKLPQTRDRLVIGAVGTRSCSDYGIEAGWELGYQMSQCGALIASGMAEGIDAAVLSGVLAADGSPMVFLAGGVDVIYPKVNAQLYDTVLQCGCVFSENPPGTRPMGGLFPKRNRMISGVSNGVLVVEAPEKSGALITARCALDQGRDVFTIPSPIYSPSGKGTNALLRDGAHPVQEGWDVVEPYQHLYPELKCFRDRVEPEMMLHGPTPKEKKPPKKQKKSIIKKTDAKKSIDNIPEPPYSDVEKTPDVRTEQEKIIVDLLLQEPLAVETLIERSGLQYAQAMTAVTMLEIRGVLQRQSGNLLGLQKK